VEITSLLAYVIFSVDGGHRWTRRTTVFAGSNTDGYPAVREVKPGRLLYCYHESIGGKSLIRGVHIEVRRKQADPE